MGSQHAPVDVKYAIIQAFHTAELDLARITVEVEGEAVTLSGAVRSSAEREEAELRALSVEGVAKVDNRIEVEILPDETAADAVYQASVESFPASDAPAWTVGPSHIEGAEAQRKRSRNH